MNNNFQPIEHFGLLDEHDRVLGLKASISKAVKSGDIVLDAGCGSGILGLLALKMGAKKVVAVDSHDLNFAKAIAEENNLLESVQYIQGDLNSLSPEALPHFDVVLAMIYSGHPIFDEGQVAVKHSLYEKFLSDGGKLVPNVIKWYAYACDWPVYDFSQQTCRFERAIFDQTNRIGLRFPSFWASELSRIQAWKHLIDPYEMIGSADPLSTRLNGDFCKILSQRSCVADIHYGQGKSLLPDKIHLEIIESGQITVVVWVRELWFEDILISSRNAISLLRKPVPVKPHDCYTAVLDQSWKQTNVIDNFYPVSGYSKSSV